MASTDEVTLDTTRCIDRAHTHDVFLRAGGYPRPVTVPANGLHSIRLNACTECQEYLHIIALNTLMALEVFHGLVH